MVVIFEDHIPPLSGSAKNITLADGDPPLGNVSPNTILRLSKVAPKQELAEENPSVSPLTIEPSGNLVTPHKSTDMVSTNHPNSVTNSFPADNSSLQNCIEAAIITISESVCSSVEITIVDSGIMDNEADHSLNTPRPPTHPQYRLQSEGAIDPQLAVAETHPSIKSQLLLDSASERNVPYDPLNVGVTQAGPNSYPIPNATSPLSESSSYPHAVNIEMVPDVDYKRDRTDIISITKLKVSPHMPSDPRGASLIPTITLLFGDNSDINQPSRQD